MADDFQIRLKGEGVSPGTVRSRDIAEVLEAVEDLLVNEVLARNDELRRDEIIIGLYSVEDRSLGLAFRTSHSPTILPVFVSTAEAISRNDYESLTDGSIEALRHISAFTKKYSCDALFDTGSRTLATISVDTNIPRESVFEGSTEILGRVLRIGGKTPRAMIELVDGSVLYCAIQEELAVDLGHNLYCHVKLSGIAKWASKSLDITEYRITGFKKFEETKAITVLRELSSLVSGGLAESEDVVQYVNSIRQGDVH
jgi:hypothetical protein